MIARVGTSWVIMSTRELRSDEGPFAALAVSVRDQDRDVPLRRGAELHQRDEALRRAARCLGLRAAVRAPRTAHPLS